MIAQSQYHSVDKVNVKRWKHPRPRSLTPDQRVTEPAKLAVIRDPQGWARPVVTLLDHVLNPISQGFDLEVRL